VWSFPVVVLDPWSERCGALVVVLVAGGVGPLGLESLDEPLGLAVGAGPVGPGPQVADLQIGDRLSMGHGAVAGAVVGHDPLDAHALGGEPGDGATEEPDAGGALLIVEDLDVGEAAGVIDGDVHDVPPGPIGAPVAALAAMGGQAGTVEPAELLDVDVDQLAGVAAAVPVRGLGWFQPGQTVQALAAEHRADRGGGHAELGRDPR